MFQLHDSADFVKTLAENTCGYVDIRAEEYQKKSITLENNQIENISETLETGLGIRFLINGAWGFCSITNPLSKDQIKETLEKTIKNTKYYSNYKKNPIKLYPVPHYNINKKYPVKNRPSIEKLISICLDCNNIIFKKPKIIKSNIIASVVESTKYFTNNEGSTITQNFTDTVIDISATAHESGLTQSVNITEGGRGGLEQILDNDLAYDSADRISTKANQLLSAKPVKENKAKIVMNPDFVALLTHEILGHPSEADRVLGKEMAWAGGAWWKGKIGQKIGSEELNVFDDPTIENTLGWYEYDDEGVKTQKTTLIEDGVLKNHFQNRETANIFDSKPTGNMRATNYRFMPLLRMACTCIDKGDWKQEEIIKDVKEGYFISNMKIPSIDMKRYNWSISCQYAQKIENGELTDLLRDVIVMGVAPEFFSSIDACGNDFTVRPITNCGKGDPMQSMIMGNGGPTIRGVATVKSV